MFICSHCGHYIMTSKLIASTSNNSKRVIDLQVVDRTGRSDLYGVKLFFFSAENVPLDFIEGSKRV